MIADVAVANARDLARRLLADDQPRRWNHVQGVAKRAELFAGRIAHSKALAQAAYLHDIGYAPSLVDTGFHQIDGARHLRREGWDEAVVNLVAHHSGAQQRGELEGLDEIYATEFPFDESLPHRELHFCDVTTGLDGGPTTVQARLADMRRRHRDNPNMIGFLDGHGKAIEDLVAEIWSALDGVGQTDAADESGLTVLGSLTHPFGQDPMGDRIGLP